MSSSSHGNEGTDYSSETYSSKDVAKRGRKWSRSEDDLLKSAIEKNGACSWKIIAQIVGSRNDLQCFHRWQKVLKPGLTKGPWTYEEDQIILQHVTAGVLKWSTISKKIPGRLGKQIRERYFNHLDPSIKRDPWNALEDRALVQAQARYGNKWAKIATLLPGRPENMVKNRWNVLHYPRKRSESLSISKRFKYERENLLDANSGLDGEETETDSCDLEDEDSCTVENYSRSIEHLSDLEVNESILSAARILISLQ